MNKIKKIVKVLLALCLTAFILVAVYSIVIVYPWIRMPDVDEAALEARLAEAREMVDSWRNRPDADNEALAALITEDQIEAFNRIWNLPPKEAYRELKAFDPLYEKLDEIAKDGLVVFPGEEEIPRFYIEPSPHSADPVNGFMKRWVNRFYPPAPPREDAREKKPSFLTKMGRLKGLLLHDFKTSLAMSDSNRAMACLDRYFKLTSALLDQPSAYFAGYSQYGYPKFFTSIFTRFPDIPSEDLRWLQEMVRRQDDCTDEVYEDFLGMAVFYDEALPTLRFEDVIRLLDFVRNVSFHSASEPTSEEVKKYEKIVERLEYETELPLFFQAFQTATFLTWRRYFRRERLVLLDTVFDHADAARDYLTGKTDELMITRFAPRRSVVYLFLPNYPLEGLCVSRRQTHDVFVAAVDKEIRRRETGGKEPIDLEIIDHYGKKIKISIDGATGWVFVDDGRSRGGYLHGAKEGNWTERDMEGQYRKGKKEGLWEGDNARGEFRNGKEEGFWEIGYESGEFRNGLKEGEWITRLDGKIIRKQIYQKGKRISHTKDNE